MIRFNKIIIAVIFFFAAAVIAVNLLLPIIAGGDGGKYYMVEINRAYADITAGNAVDFDAYRYIKDIAFLSKNADSEDIKAFFENGNTPYMIKIMDDSQYVKFTYIYDFKEAYENILLAVNVYNAVIGAAVIAVLLFFRRQIIKPFNEVSELPYELSKGHLTKGLKENKNRFFGRFVWGLDLLRENIEQRKMKELELEKEKKTLILSISHDIKTPLSAIKLYAKALSENLYGEDKRSDIALKINENSEKIEVFVNDIIQTSKEDFLNIEVNNGEFYLEELMSSVTRYYSDKLDYLKTEFTIQPFQNCFIYGDIEKCLEVFENIIENSIKYGDGKNIEVSFAREEDCCLVTVSNTGNTLPEGEIIHIFDSFWRGSNAKDKKGSGLGLYICRQILTKMKGDIFAEAQNGNMSITIVLKIL